MPWLALTPAPPLPVVTDDTHAWPRRIVPPPSDDDDDAARARRVRVKREKRGFGSN
jgi:hypothetical protein